MQDTQLQPIPQSPQANNTLYISSLEIAERTGKQHKTVLRDIRNMLVKLYGDEFIKKDNPDLFDAVQAHFKDGTDLYHQDQRGFAWQRDKRGYISEMFLDKRLSLTLATGYDIDLRIHIIDRWQELEAQAQKPDLHKALNDPASLRNLLLENVEKVLALESKIEEDKPKTQFYDAFVNASGLYGLQNAARATSAKPNLYIRWLKQHYLFYQGGCLVPRSQYIQMGIFEVKVTTVNEKDRTQTYITPKGLEYLSARMPEHIRLNGSVAA